MRTIYIIISFLLFSLKIQSQNYTKTIIENDTFYILPKSYNFYSFDGQSKIKDSFPDGKWLQIDSGNIKYKFSLKNNLIEGQWFEYLSNKTLKSKGYYLKGEKVGPFYTYFNSGEIFSIYYFYNGSTPEVCFFYNKGNIKKRFISINDSIVFHTFWYENGMKESEGCLILGQPDEDLDIPEYRTGIWQYLNINGTRKMTGYYVNDKKNSVWNYYDEIGDFIKSEFYLNGELIKTSTKYIYDETGIIKGEIKK